MREEIGEKGARVSEKVGTKVDNGKERGRRGEVGRGTIGERRERERKNNRGIR